MSWISSFLALIRFSRILKNFYKRMSLFEWYSRMSKMYTNISLSIRAWLISFRNPLKVDEAFSRNSMRHKNSEPRGHLISFSLKVSNFSCLFSISLFEISKITTLANWKRSLSWMSFRTSWFYFFEVLDLLAFFSSLNDPKPEPECEFISSSSSKLSIFILFSNLSCFSYN